MKKTLVLAVLTIFGFNYIQAQSNKEDVDMIQAAFGKDKKDLVSQYMQVPMKDSIAFWKLYDQYETERKALGKDRINLIQEYADSYENLTDAKASELATKSLATDAKYTALQQSYLRKFGTVLGGRNAAKLMQLEVYLQTLVRANVMTQVPFIDEIDKSKLQQGAQQ